LLEIERAHVLDHLRAPRFADQTPTEVFATLLDEGNGMDGSFPAASNAP
jgi:hypothetical protein